MNKEQLIALGLTEEQADKVVAGIGTMIPKSRFDELNDAKKQLDTDLAARDTQLEELKKTAGASEELKGQIATLQAANDSTKTEYEEKIQKQSYNYALERALTEAKVKNPKAVKALLDIEAIKLDGEKLLGLDEQLKTLSESDGYLFARDSDGKPVFKGLTPADGIQQVNTEPKAGDYGKQMAEGLAKSNEGLEDARKSYFE
ncbi:phage scaffolding protein [Sporosarcina sp. resist]|uniref:phage scaffolding protein n=1 Tax=Sporosarcina sp. resist TaxID=2762563 RepID=UPI00210562CE|nr:phage scaffolding protein [Sporosarcina sp. resist]